MKRILKKTCPCCEQVFETTRKDKVYLNATHQKRFNNTIQNRKRENQFRLTKDHYTTYRIYRALLGSRIEATYSKDFLKGKGAKLYLMSGVDIMKGERVEMLFDIAIIPNENEINLKRKKHA
jgi:hypothetical protein